MSESNAIVPEQRLIYKVNIGSIEFSVYLHDYWGLILLSSTSKNRCEIMHGQVTYINDDSPGWYLTRYGDEPVLDLNSLEEADFSLITKEFGINVFENTYDAPYSNTNSFSNSICAIVLERWSMENTLLASKLKISADIDLSIEEYFKQGKNIKH